MKNRELDQILKSISVPEPADGYWERFPKDVLQKLEISKSVCSKEESTLQKPFRQQTPLATRPGGHEQIEADRYNILSDVRRKILSPWGLTSLGLSLALVCIILGFKFISRQGRDGAMTAQQLAGLQKLYEEIEVLFPNQVRAIVWDQQGAHLQLAETPDVPASPPVYIKICGTDGCLRFVTFSGQQIQVNGEACDLLVDGQGRIMLVGPHLLWSSAKINIKAGAYRIEAKQLEGTS